jgi:hypothetical protein
MAAGAGGFTEESLIIANTPCFGSRLIIVIRTFANIPRIFINNPLIWIAIIYRDSIICKSTPTFLQKVPWFANTVYLPGRRRRRRAPFDLSRPSTSAPLRSPVAPSAKNGGVLLVCSRGPKMSEQPRLSSRGGRRMSVTGPPPPRRARGSEAQLLVHVTRALPAGDGAGLVLSGRAVLPDAAGNGGRCRRAQRTLTGVDWTDSDGAIRTHVRRGGGGPLLVAELRGFNHGCCTCSRAGLRRTASAWSSPSPTPSSSVYFCISCDGFCEL